MAWKKPTLTIDDYGGNADKLAEGQKIVDAAWNRVNPAGTAIVNTVKPTLTQADTGGMKMWGEHQRALDRALDRQGGEKSAGELVAQGLMDGTLTGRDAQSQYAAIAANKMGQLESMGDFSYDFNKDPLFKMLSESYMAQARQAANDVNAQAAARTGGYGNSYGATAAGATYNDALRGLYDQVPELQEAAYQKYLNDRSDLYRQADYYGGLEEQAYGRQWNEEARDYEHSEAEKDRAYEQAMAAAQLGEYGPLSELLGVDFSKAQMADDVNLYGTLAAQLGPDKALEVLARIAQTTANKNAAAGSGTGTGGDGSTGSGDGGAKQITASDAASGQYPDVSAGTAILNGKTVLLPPSQANGNKYRFYEYNGVIYYDATDKSGRIQRGLIYNGPLVGTDGKIVRPGSGSSVPYPLVSGMDPVTASTGYVPVTTGSSFWDAVINLNGENQALMRLAGEANGLTGDALNEYADISGVYDKNLMDMAKLGPGSTGGYGGDDSYSGSGGKSGKSGYSGSGYSGYSGSGKDTAKDTGTKTETPANNVSPVTQTMKEANISASEWDKLMKKYLG